MRSIGLSNSRGGAWRPSPHDLVALSGLAIAVVTFLLLVDGGHWRPGDTITYLAAGERLDAGHQLYALMPGDRVLPVVPPYFTVPLVSPPLIAVLWRPLALLPEPLIVNAWWLAMIVCLAIAVAMVVRSPSMVGPVLMYVLAVPLALEAYQGNINALILLGALVAWRAFATGHAGWAGAIVGVLIVLKVTPLILGVWILACGGRRGFLGLFAGILVAGSIGLVGAGLDAHLAYLSVIRDTTSIGPTDLSLAGFARTLGVPADFAARIELAVDVLGVIAVVALRRRPAWAYRVGIVTMVAGSPVVYVNTFLLLLPVIAPTLWPMTTRSDGANSVTTDPVVTTQRPLPEPS